MRSRYLIYWLFILLTISSCSKNEQEEIVATRQLHVLLLPHELGDMGYGDTLLRGIQTIRRDAKNIDIRIYQPESIEQGEQIFYKWATSDAKSQPSLFVVTADDYEGMLVRYFKDNDLAKNKEILLFESENSDELPIYNFTISSYGASYLAGIVAAQSTSRPALIVWGNSMDVSTFGAVDGFKDGYYSQQSGNIVATTILANDWTGYVMANDVYINMSTWTKSYGFIYPIAGGSNNGVYHYLREFPKDTYTAGFDTDSSHLCSQVVGSTVKHIDRLVIAFIEQWLESYTMPTQGVYGLDSGYIDWVLAPRFEVQYRDIVEQERNTAILKEREYEQGL